MTEMRREQDHWDRLAHGDAMWVILTEPGKQGAWNASEFFESGRREIAGALALLHDRFGLSPRRGVALDFGCGVGRLSQALCERFDHVHGVDISAEMVRKAREQNRHGDRVTYHVNASDRLAMLADGSIAFAYSRLTLQHIPRAAMRTYIGEIARVLAADGIAMFQVLSRARRLSVRVRHRIRDLFPDSYRRLRDAISRRPRWELNAISEHEVRAIVNARGCLVRAFEDDGMRDPEFESRWVIVTRTTRPRQTI